MSFVTVLAIMVGYFIGSLISSYVLELSREGIHWPLIVVVVSVAVFLLWVLLWVLL